MSGRRTILSLISKDRRLTPFDKAVLCATLKIPKGEVRTYGWIAKVIHKPNASRAVGNSLHKNPYPIIVPCHRVIRSDGSLGGYGGGIKRKRALLLQEGYLK